MAVAAHSTVQVIGPGKATSDNTGFHFRVHASYKDYTRQCINLSGYIVKNYT